MISSCFTKWLQPTYIYYEPKTWGGKFFNVLSPQRPHVYPSFLSGVLKCIPLAGALFVGKHVLQKLLDKHNKHVGEIAEKVIQANAEKVKGNGNLDIAA
jgi:hypothetical protein